MSDLPNPINRYEKYLNAIATGNFDDLPTPITREEVFLDYIARNSGGSGSGEVTGVKGNAEGSYRRGNVNLTPTHLGLGNVDNTSDLNKPVSTAQQTALDGKVDKVTGKGLSKNDYTDADKAIVDGVTSALSDKVDKIAGKGLSTNDYDNTAKGIVDGVTSALAGKVSTSSVGSANGVAELDANGRVPSSQLPSYVDDTVEGYLNSVDGKFYVDSSYTTEIAGETGKIYVTLDTNKTYRWSGSGFVEISESLALGETSSTAYAGNKGKANADAIAGIKNGTSINSFSAVETALAGKASSSDLGNKSNLTTTDKSSAVAAINEVNGFFVNLGAITANDWTNFFENACAAFHALNPKTYVVHNVFLSWGGTRYSGQFIDYGEAVDFTVTGGGGGTLYCGYSLLGVETKFHTYVEYTEAQSLLNIDSAHAVNDWNLKKIGKNVVLYTRNVKDLPDGWTQLGTIPNGYIPQFDFYTYIYSTNKNTWFGLHLMTDGKVDVWNGSGSAISGEIYLNDTVAYNVY